MAFLQTYNYSDVGLIPTQKSVIRSRSYCDTSINFLGTSCSLPVVLAPMEKVVGPEMATTISKLGGISFLPRTADVNKDLNVYTDLLEKTDISSFSVIPSVPTVNAGDLAKQYFDRGAPTTICIDLANGFSSTVERAVEQIREKVPANINIVTGNVGSIEGFAFLTELGVDGVRVSIGSGAGCLTANKTGVGVSPAWLVRQIAEWKEVETSHTDKVPLIIADGGIAGPRELCIALALGADAVMMGRYFASRRESAGLPVRFNGQLYKQYAGQASFAIKKSHRYIEGSETLVEYEGTTEEGWLALRDALQSAMSYMNMKTIEKFKFLPDNCFGFLK